MKSKLRKLSLNMLFEIVKSVYQDLKRCDIEELSKIVEQGCGDVVYKIDVRAENIVENTFKRIGDEVCPILGITEKTGKRVYGDGEPEYFIIVDPIDGTRPLMYQLHPAFSLVGIGKIIESRYPVLGDIEFCAMFQIPNLDKKYIDLVKAMKGKGTMMERYEVDTWKKIKTFRPTPSKAKSIEHGFIVISAPFSPREYLARVGDYIVKKVVREGRARVFYDEYLSTAGQFYRLLLGKYRIVVDLRPLQEKLLKTKGGELGLCAHPYDVCCALSLKEVNCPITDGYGNEKDFWRFPCDAKTDVHYIAYANEILREKIEPIILEAISKIFKIDSNVNR